MSAQEDRERYLAAAHAMQCGVGHMMNFRREETEPKHLRTGINSAMVEHAALVSLLIEKGVITNEEYQKRLADKMEEERDAYVKALKEVIGTDVNIKLV